MKEWMEKIRKGKVWPLLALLGICIALSLISQDGGEQALITQEEQRIGQALSLIQGAGECRVILHFAPASGFGESAPLTGAIIIAQGARDLAARLRLLQAAETLLGLTARQVEIFPMEEGP